MIVTYEWLNEWIDLRDKSVEDICSKLDSIGLEVDSVTKQRIPPKVVVGKVLECEKHPNANRLNICQVDIGDKTLQIVCGAKNVAKDQFVAVATVGTKLGKDFEIKGAKLRGVDSYGMICSSNEIGLIKTNDGIMVLDESIGELKLGKELREYPLLNDTIIRIELTANRGDCLSIYGVARDLSAVYNKELKQKEYTFVEDRIGIGRVLELDSDSGINSALRYMFFENKGVKCDFLTSFRLYMCEEELKTHIENALTYATINSGVILRAYDFDKFEKDKDSKVILRLKKESDGIDRVYNGKDIVCLVGLTQNEKFKVSKDTKRVLVGASFIDSEYISLKKYETKIEADELYYRSSRGSEGDLEFGLKEVSQLINDNAKIYADYEETIDNFEDRVIQVESSFIDEFIGNHIKSIEVVNTLDKLGFEVNFRGEFYVIKVPLFRSDIKNPQDVIEEIVRIVGIDNIKAKPLCFNERPKVNSVYQNIKKRRHYKTKAVGLGYFESISYFFDNKEELKAKGFNIIDDKKDIINPITNELNTLRTTLCLNLLRATSKNAKAGRKRIKLFENGRVVDKELNEIEKFSFIYSGQRDVEGYKSDTSECSFKDIVDDLFSIVGKCELVSTTPKNKLFNPYEYAVIKIKGKKAGFVGRVHLEVEKEYDLKATYICELDFDALRYEIVKVKEYSKFQTSQKDLSFLAPKQMKFEEIKEALRKDLPSVVQNYYVIDIYEGEELEDKKGITIRFVLQNMNKTLEDSDIKSGMDKIVEVLKSKLGLELR
jgi:phenylalanyl-tRNA synthetase beta chain